MQSLTRKGLTVLLMLFFMTSSCVSSRQTIQIPDYLLVTNGKELVGTKELTAFVFENNLTALPIEQFLSAKFKSDNYSQKEYWITIEKDKYKIIIYDYAEFEKYFISSNYSVINALPENAKNGDQRKFIAISMIDAYNDDCLADNSIFQNIAVKYLKQLKDEFYNQR
jgi:hypothetical protein